MRIIDQLKGLDSKGLATLEANAERLLKSGSAAQRAEAQPLLFAIEEERIRRKVEERAQRQAVVADVKASVKDLGLFEGPVLAFEEVPPTANDVAVLKTINDHPGSDLYFIAKVLGWRESNYLNIAVGIICSNRDPYLGKAPPPLRPGQSDKVYSALIIDFTPHPQPDGSERQGWTLKPEVKAALEHLGIL